jgi:hypothetical protein
MFEVRTLLPEAKVDHAHAHGTAHGPASDGPQTSPQAH